MSISKGWTRAETELVLEELAASIETSEPAELAADFRDSGDDLSVIENRMKTAAIKGIKAFKQQGLHHARERYQQSSLRIGRQLRSLSGSSDDRRRRLFSALQAHPGIEASLTIQHRDFGEMTEDDINSALEEMEILGVLGEPDDDAS